MTITEFIINTMIFINFYIIINIIIDIYNKKNEAACIIQKNWKCNIIQS